MNRRDPSKNARKRHRRCQYGILLLPQRWRSSAWRAQHAQSGTVDYGKPDRNMYGCVPCPRCGSKYRAPYQKVRFTVECDDCGRIEPGRHTV
jgi:hypothetical protein